MTSSIQLGREDFAVAKTGRLARAGARELMHAAGDESVRESSSRSWSQGWTGWARALKTLAVFLLLTVVVVTESYAQQAAVCNRPSYGRGVGTLPTRCGPGQTYSDGLCYSGCPPGRVGVGPACHTPCPAGWAPVGADPTAVSCWKPPLSNQREFSYVRGAGYVIWEGDRCARENQAAGGCEQQGAIHYPRCKAGYIGIGPVCWQQLQNCPAGFRDDGLACAKPPLEGRGVGTIPTGCEVGEYQAGLCYSQCNAGFGGVGPVCWGQCPRAMPVDCGLMCGRSANDCQQAAMQQVSSMAQVLATALTAVATAGTSLATQATVQAARAAAVSSAKIMIREALKSMPKNTPPATVRATVEKMAQDSGKKLSEKEVTALVNTATGVDFDFGDLEPTGLLDFVKAFQVPMCQADVPLPPKQGGRAVQVIGQAGFHLLTERGTRHAFANYGVYLGCGFAQLQPPFIDPKQFMSFADGGTIDSAQACLQLRADTQSIYNGPKAGDPPGAGGSGGVGGAPESDPKLAAVAGVGVGGGVGGGAGASAPIDPRLAVLDVNFYLTQNADLQRAFGTPNNPKAQEAARQHWLDYGLREGRDPAPNFSLRGYLGRYVDLQRAFGPTNWEAAFRHWVDHGQRERRDPRPAGATGQRLVKAVNNDRVYLVNAAGQRAGIATPQVFEGCRLSWSALEVLHPDTVNAFSEGPLLSTADQCLKMRAIP